MNKNNIKVVTVKFKQIRKIKVLFTIMINIIMSNKIKIFINNNQINLLCQDLMNNK